MLIVVEKEPVMQVEDSAERRWKESTNRAEYGVVSSDE